MSGFQWLRGIMTLAFVGLLGAGCMDQVAPDTGAPVDDSSANSAKRTSVNSAPLSLATSTQCRALDAACDAKATCCSGNLCAWGDTGLRCRTEAAVRAQELKTGVKRTLCPNICGSTR